VHPSDSSARYSMAAQAHNRSLSGASEAVSARKAAMTCPSPG
jgi:hypothetical protein